MELQSRFAFLLQPIRDLTKNWDVDVAAQLDDYLSEVRGGEVQREGEREGGGGGKEKGRGVRDLGRTVQEGWTDKMALV